MQESYYRPSLIHRYNLKGLLEKIGEIRNKVGTSLHVAMSNFHGYGCERVN